MLPTRIMELSSSIYQSFAFLAGLRLNIFTALSNNQLTTKQIAQKLNVKENQIEKLLHALVATGLLAHENNKYRNTEEAEQYLVQDKPNYLGNHVYVNPHLNYWNWMSAVKIADTIKTGEPQDYYDFNQSTYEQLLNTFRNTMPVAIKAGEELAKWFDFTKVKTVVDVGGSSGGLAFALKQAYPHLNLRVDDLPSIVPVANTILSENDADDIRVKPCDILKAPLSESCDVAVLRAVIQVLSPIDAEVGIHNVTRSINSGGYLIILGHVLDDSKVSPVEEVGMNLILMNWYKDAGCYTFSQHKLWASKAGLTDVRLGSLPNGDRVIIARKP
ncbi:MAG: acetylserotonin O-methyltransferase [Candidatus Bathyarchaeota archaeon]|nr:acetylserotonin O-methyltransferase [Candidatus Bathyarchaeota archaeon]